MPQKVAPQLLREETERIIASFAPAEQYGSHHAGGWKTIGLVSCGGDPYEDRPLDGPYRKTPALKMSPILEALIDSFKCDKERVRLSKLEPGHNILWHDDPDLDNNRLARLHIPVITNDKVEFQLSHEDMRWKTGELWYADFSFPHRVYNGGSEARIHLMIDLVVNDWVRSLFPSEFRAGAQARIRVKALCSKVYNAYYLVQALKLSRSKRLRLKGKDEVKTLGLSRGEAPQRSCERSIPGGIWARMAGALRHPR